MGTLGGGNMKEIFFFGLDDIVHIYELTTSYFYDKENCIACFSLT